jgi:hypothetical protein
MQPQIPEMTLRRNLFSCPLPSKILAKNPLFEVISLHGPTGPLIIQVVISVLFDTIKKEKGERGDNNKSRKSLTLS